jgi:hypothetical protein
MRHRPIPPEATMAETCFVERWPLARAREIANASGLVEDGEVLISCQFVDHSTVHYRTDTGDIFGIELVYDFRDGKVVAPRMDERWQLTPDADIKLIARSRKLMRR